MEATQLPQDVRIPGRISRQLVPQADGCWSWQGHLNGTGYGITTRTGTNKAVVVHRYVYELLIGSIPEGLQLDHLCRNRVCANPAHMEPVTQRENLLRGDTITAASAAATHCPSGHPYAGANLRISLQGHRYCRSCRRIQEAARRVREGDAHRARQRQYDAAYRARKRATS